MPTYLTFVVHPMMMVITYKQKRPMKYIYQEEELCELFSFTLAYVCMSTPTPARVSQQSSVTHSSLYCITGSVSRSRM
jgi:hypothetical protein